MSNEVRITLTIKLPEGATVITVAEGEDALVAASVPFASGPKPAPLASLEGDSDWVCPRHGSFRTVPAGTSKTTGKPYDSFRVCREQGCNEKEPRRRVA